MKKIFFKTVVATTLVILLWSCAHTSDGFNRAKTPVESIGGHYETVVYQATKNGHLIIDHNEGSARISLFDNGVRFQLTTHQYQNEGNKYLHKPEPGMVFGIYNEVPLEVKGKPYDVRFRETIPATISFYTGVPQVGQTKKLENVPVHFDGSMKENWVELLFKDFRTEINISFEVEGDRYNFYITRMATSRGLAGFEEENK